MIVPDRCGNLEHDFMRKKQMLLKFAKYIFPVLLLLTLTYVKGEQAQAELALPPMQPFTFVQDGEFSKQLHLPTYEWIPQDSNFKGIVFAVHGLTLHGKTFQITGRTFASHGLYVIAADMRGFGRCYKDPDHKFSDEKNNRHAVNYRKSTDDFIALAKLVKQRYPNVPIILLGESLGCTTAVRLAAESPETFHSIILSAPAMRLNPAMFFTPSVMFEYTIGLASHLTTGISMHSFFKHLVSNDPQVVQETLADPLIRKNLYPRELIRTLIEIKHTSHYAGKIEKNIPALFIQGSDDKCVSPLSVAKLANKIESDDQTIRWFYSYGHLAFETSHLRAPILDALIVWFRQHRPEYEIQEKDLQSQITALGGTLRE